MFEKDERVKKLAKRPVFGPPATAVPSEDEERQVLPAGDQKPEPAALAGEIPQPPEIIDRTQLAQLLRVDPRTVSRMVARGELPEPVLSRGGRPRWLRHFVMEFLEKRHRKQSELNRRKESKLQ